MRDYIEIPLFEASIFYYDSEYCADLAHSVQDILEHHGFFPPELFFAGKYTNNRLKKYSPSMRQYFPLAYSEKDILTIEMGSKDNADATEFWRFEWQLTFLKSSDYSGQSRHMPWNVLTLKSTYGRLGQEENYVRFMSCVQELIDLLNPFYASLDDVSNAVALMREAHERCFNPQYVQQLYWGNYFGESHCLHYGYNKLIQLPACNVQMLGNGVFFTLTDHATGYSSKECRHRRRVIKQYLDK